MQLNRLLAGNADKAANQRVVRNIATKYPELPQARRARTGGRARRDNEAAIAAAQEAQKLRPDWGSPCCSKRRCCSARLRPQSGWASSSRAIPAHARRGSAMRVLVMTAPARGAQADGGRGQYVAQESRRRLCGGPARLPAEGLLGGGGVHEARPRLQLSRPRGACATCSDRSPREQKLWPRAIE